MEEMTTRTYIAAPFGAKQKVHELSIKLRQFGYETHARWLGHDYPYPGGHDNPANHDYAKMSAEHDLEDAERAMLMIVFIEPHPGSHYGWLVELGIGLACAWEVWMIGENFNVFSHLDGVISSNGCIVRHFDHEAAVIDYLIRERDMTK